MAKINHTLFNRLGNKSKLADKIIAHFPAHNLYLEPFFGSGSIFFAKPKAKYNILNDNDSDIYNFYEVFNYQREALIKEIELTPYSQEVLNFLRTKSDLDPIKKAVRFLMMSNWTFLGNGATIRYGIGNYKSLLIEAIENFTIDFFKDTQFSNKDVFDFFKLISYKSENEYSKTFCYCDPPYIGTASNYADKSWNEDKFVRLIEVLQGEKIKFAISEFSGDFVLSVAKEKGLNVIPITERQNLTSKTRKVEILLTNYEKENTIF